MNPRRRWSEKAFLLFPQKLCKASHSPWVRTNYLYEIFVKHIVNFVIVYFTFSLYKLYFSSSCLHFKPTCSIQSLILLGLVLKMGAFNVTGKRSVFDFDDSICFYLVHILSNTDIDFVNNFQLIKDYSEMVLSPNFCSFQNFNFLGKWRSLNVSQFSFVPV